VTRRALSGLGAVARPAAPGQDGTSADYNSLGPAAGFIENFIRDAVLPRYVGGTDDDLVIFCGSGAAAAR
jgi:hypothetical protein